MPKKLSNKAIKHIEYLHYKYPEISNTEIAKLVGISDTPVYKYRPRITRYITCKREGCNKKFKVNGTQKYCSYEHMEDTRNYRMRAKRKRISRDDITEKYNNKLKEIWNG